MCEQPTELFTELTSDTRAVFAQGSKRPLLVDDWPDGVRYLCGHCREMILVDGAASDQIWNVAFECSNCEGVSASPKLPPGMALPTPIVLVPDGRWQLDQPVELKRQALVGESAVRQRFREAGYKGEVFGRTGASKSTHVSEELLYTWIGEIKAWLGPRFDKLRKADQRGKKSSTPPRRRHGLMVVFDSIETAIDALHHGSGQIDESRLVEFHALRTIHNRWHSHPLWPKLVAALDAEYEHTIVTLWAATFLEDAGNNIVFHESEHARAADLLLVLAPQRHALVEVKAPLALHDRESVLTDDDADCIIRKSVKKAGTGRRGQLPSTTSAVLCIGGLRLTTEDLDRLERAANKYLKDATTQGRHQHLLGITIVSPGSTSRDIVVGGTSMIEAGGALNVRVSRNPGYCGNDELREDSTTPLNREDD